MWAILRGRRLEELKFRRQVPVGRYVVDFLCLRHRLIVEVDGPFHDAAHDARRDEWLKSQGFRILRFSDSEVRARPHAVMATITAAAGMPPSPLAPKQEG